MNLDLEILSLSRGLAAHAAARQHVIAGNVANADTPGYRAQDIADFASLLDQSEISMRTTRSTHLSGNRASAGLVVTEMETGSAELPNGNNVSLEQQMMKSVELRHEHELALGIYRKSLDLLRLSLGRR